MGILSLTVRAFNSGFTELSSLVYLFRDLYDYCRVLPRWCRDCCFEQSSHGSTRWLCSLYYKGIYCRTAIPMQRRCKIPGGCSGSLVGSAYNSDGIGYGCNARSYAWDGIGQRIPRQNRCSGRFVNLEGIRNIG